jgi:hypothetical protein
MTGQRETSPVAVHEQHDRAGSSFCEEARRCHPVVSIGDGALNTIAGYEAMNIIRKGRRLPTDGVWRGLARRDNGYFNKVFLWQQGYDVQKDPTPHIVVGLRRLNDQAPLVTHRDGTNARLGDAWAMLTGVTFPAEGCREVTAHHSGHSLTFVLSVQPQTLPAFLKPSRRCAGNSFFTA